MTLDLFADSDTEQPAQRIALGAQSWLLRGFALPWVDNLLPALRQVLRQSPLRHMVTPGGFTMSVALSNCGDWGWTSDRSGYRYSAIDPRTGRPWPPMPDVVRALARAAASDAGFDDFIPDACLINRYVPGARVSLHQDKNEADFAYPIVSVSLGLPAVFQFGGTERNERPQRVPLLHGDVAVWGGVDRLRYHGILPIKEGLHPVLGAQRINITMRKAH
ncbi:DNA oxidative demethylase AlkB [Pseudomonas sp. R5(2019)]|uniref:DNA oxidative demethylase AlkB n=1 Tax=Pseudomonas sp. R5(2019) TaxID=2697566 RepID=UPI001411E7BC|nr:DNA oxidative demethylase AlkB [Pseudomonas sp. R5(2019)]NBA97415.1 DNA oxidative demethylase AlkB [Pseudomonas sp. R5(2019)]